MSRESEWRVKWDVKSRRVRGRMKRKVKGAGAGGVGRDVGWNVPRSTNSRCPVLHRRPAGQAPGHSSSVGAHVHTQLKSEGPLCQF